MTRRIPFRRRRLLAIRIERRTTRPLPLRCDPLGLGWMELFIAGGAA
jgi:hypothetical protein